MGSFSAIVHDLKDILELSKIMLSHKHGLVHKATEKGYLKL